jgi:hypothetical protein
MPEQETLVLAFTNPIEGRDDEFNKWYDEAHLREVASAKGWVSGERFKLDDVQLDGWSSPLHKYLAIYRLIGDTDEALKSHTALVEGGEISHRGDLFDAAGSNTLIYTPMGVRHVNPDP